MKKIIALSSLAFLSTLAFADADMQKQIDDLKAQLEKLEKTSDTTNKTLGEVKAHDAHDNIKFGVDFRNAVDVLEYKNNETGETASNDSLLTSRLYLTMGAAPMDGLTFKGKLAVYSTWGSELYTEDPALKDWAGSSKATDTVMRVKEAYFLYSNSIGEQPISFSVGRRPSTDGYLANYRENEQTSGSPMAHITNMEVNAAMVMLDFDRYATGAYSKFVYGRAHAGEIENVYSSTGPYATVDGTEDTPVDFFLFLGNAYNNGQYQIGYEWAHILNTKGENLDPALLYADSIKIAAGEADMFALSFKTDGIGDEINDFLDASTFFTSVAMTQYDAKNGYSLIGESDGGMATGYSYWIGLLVPDMMTDAGKFGLEFNHGSKDWTPMTWAEDTATGSKIAVRGEAYEAYWNFDLFGVKYLPSQIRYTYAQHDYTPNINCAGWVAPVAVDIESTDIRLAVSYRY